MNHENKRPKFAMSMASAYINKEIQKSLFGKSFVPMVAYLHICVFVLQQCGLLGRMFVGKEIPFITVFAADAGKEEMALEGFEAMIPTEVLPYLENARTFLDVVHHRERRRKRSDDDLRNFILKHGQEKLEPNWAKTAVAEWGLIGSLTGLTNPLLIEELAEATFTHDVEDWKMHYEIGIVSTAEPVTRDDAEADVLSRFHGYCAKYYPDIFSTLFP